MACAAWRKGPCSGASTHQSWDWSGIGPGIGPGLVKGRQTLLPQCSYKSMCDLAIAFIKAFTAVHKGDTMPICVIRVPQAHSLFQFLQKAGPQIRIPNESWVIGGSVAEPTITKLHLSWG